VSLRRSSGSACEGENKFKASLNSRTAKKGRNLHRENGSVWFGPLPRTLGYQGDSRCEDYGDVSITYYEVSAGQTQSLLAGQVFRPTIRHGGQLSPQLNTPDRTS
jgi:hypothetical protein